MMAVFSFSHRRDLRVFAALLPSLLLTLAFRCPGPEPSGNGAEEGGGGGTTASTATGLGGGGLGGEGIGGSGGDPGCDTSQTSADPLNCGACGRACSSNGVDEVRCIGGVCDSTCEDGLHNALLPQAPAPDDGCETPEKRVFVTATAYASSFGGAAQADALCQALSEESVLGGTWMSWVSDASGSPSTRFTQSPGPYVLLDGTVIADSWADLTDGTLAAPINLAPNGETLPFREVWTGTSAIGGVAAGAMPCQDWTANQYLYTGWVGRTDGTDLTWSEVFLQGCERDNVHLYCFEQ